MFRKLTLLVVLANAFSGLAMAGDSTHPHDRDIQDLNGRAEPPMLGIHWARNAANSRAGGPNNPLMSNHGGKIMPTSMTRAIFWGPSWSNSAFVGDKITGLETWYQGFSNSKYAQASTEYDGNNGQVGSSSSYLGSIVDTSTATGGATTTEILAEVCKVVTNPDPSGNGYYAVYTDVKRGHAGYCAWHSYGKCGATAVQFAFFFNLDGDAGCDPADTTTGHSQGLAALANVTAHELSEAMTDPASPGAWYDNSGAENGDKCAWTFGASPVTFSNNSKWKLQGEWSNAAYNAGTGYPNSSGQRGCLSGL
ncbi:MAG: hypothetical protein V4508_06795 [Pseudomonadota bacterium]